MKKTPKITCKLGKDETLIPKKPSQQIRLIKHMNVLESNRRRNSELSTQGLCKDLPPKLEEVFDGIDFSRINTNQSEEDHDLIALVKIFKTIDRPPRTQHPSPRRRYQKKRSEGKVVPHVFVKLS